MFCWHGEIEPPLCVVYLDQPDWRSRLQRQARPAVCLNNFGYPALPSSMHCIPLRLPCLSWRTPSLACLQVVVRSQPILQAGAICSQPGVNLIVDGANIRPPQGGKPHASATLSDTGVSFTSFHRMSCGNLLQSYPFVILRAESVLLLWAGHGAALGSENVPNALRQSRSDLWLAGNPHPRVHVQSGALFGSICFCVC